MYIRILKRHNRYVAEEIKRVIIDESLQTLCVRLGNMGITKGMIMNEMDENAFKFNESEICIIKELLPD